MSNIKQEDFKMMNEALSVWNLQKGAEVLDIGCGQGEAVEYMEKEYGYKACGIDLSKGMICKGLNRNPNLDIRYGDGEFLDGFLSYSFDGVRMNRVLSLIGLPDEALHEAYCVLKKGGKLFISDLYIKNPDTELLKTAEIDAQKQQNMPHSEGECGSEHGEASCDCDEHVHEECVDCSNCEECHIEIDEGENEEEHRYRVVNFRSKDRFLMSPFMKELEEIGYAKITWQDCSLGSSKSSNPNDKYETGRFMLIAEKPL